MTSKSYVKNLDNFTSMFDKKFNDAIIKLIHFLEKNDFQGWEPYDILSDRWMLIIKPRLFRVLITQIFRLSPIFVHPHFKEKKYYTKAVALLAHAFLILYEISKNIKYRDQAIFFLDWLEKHRSLLTKNFSLGSQYQLNMKNYDSSTNTPSPFITALAIEAFISAFEILGDDHYLEVATSGIRFFLDELPQIQISFNQSYFIYHPNNLKFIPNLAAKICGTMARFYSISGDKTILKTIMNNLRYVIHWQRDDGSWYYSPDTKYSDNFHTGFILEALAKFEYYVQDHQFNSAFLKGLSYYVNNFFSSRGRPNHKKLSGLPRNADSLLTKVDIRDCAQGIVLFSFLLQQNKNQSAFALNLAKWSIDHFQAKQGYFYYQQLPLYTIKRPFISMQAWMLFGLSKMLKAMRAKPVTIETVSQTKEL